MHKTFISYHHRNDQDLKNKLIEEFGGYYFIDKSVSEGDINTQNTEETIMRTIKEDFLSDSTVTLILIGEETAQRPFINSEIQASLWGNNPNGIIAVVRDEIYDIIFLNDVCNNPLCNCGIPTRTPTHLYQHYLPDLVFKNRICPENKPHFTESEVYCSLTRFSTFIQNPEKYIDEAFEKRKSGKYIIKKKLSSNTPKIEAKVNSFVQW